jgi:hypothetical protein
MKADFIFPFRKYLNLFPLHPLTRFGKREEGLLMDGGASLCSDQQIEDEIFV